MKKRHLTFKIFSLIVLNDIVETVAQLFMKKGLLHTGIGAVTFNNIFEFALRTASSALIWLGIIISILNFFLWLIILYRVDLSIAMPVGSTIYIFVPLLAIFFLHEQVSPLRWAGIFLIILGIHFVAKSKKASQGAS
jgi:drug/metabolite transporter (DMT)-like permease